MNTAQANYIRLVNRQRGLFVNKAEPLFYKALQVQLEPIFHLGVLHPIGTEVDHLIHPEPLQKAFKAVYVDVVNHFGRATFNSLSKSGDAKLTYKDKQDDYEDEIDEFIHTVSGKFITDITTATRDEIKTFIASSQDEGWGAAKLASELKKHFKDFDRMRSLRIARTEVGRASNFAGDAASQRFDFEMTKTWLHGGSSKFDRESHVDASGQTVDNNEDFEVEGDYTPSYPQDGSGGADQEVNCNCAVYRSRR